MQVHYNLLAGAEPDVSATQLRLAAGDADLTNLGTVLLPAPVELPCRPGHDACPLCDRDAAVADVKKRFGEGAGSTADLLHFLCGGEPRAGRRRSPAPARISEPMTIHGRRRTHAPARPLDQDRGQPRHRPRRRPCWTSRSGTSTTRAPSRSSRCTWTPWDTVEVTCEHTQSLRDQLPSFEGQPERYVVWGEGTTDEMCLGILQVTRP